MITAGLLSASQATIVFSDDFESPVTSTTYNVANTSQTIDTAKWVRSTSGFKANQNGLVSELNTGDAITVDGGNQAWAGRYTSNTGVTTAFGTIGSLTTGDTITVSFDAAIDGSNSGTNISAYLVLFDGGARNATESDLKNTFANLDQNTGQTATSTWTTYNLSYVVGDATAGGAYDANMLGKDIAVRFTNRNGALIDNVVVDITSVPEPSTTALLGLGGLALILRRRK